ncbi:hypothetical protein [Streptomyces sp. CB00455]|uniref:hypothetical protein n=1 Tax=Streptomyces sp. CB00455 TaxID=1703927 RepID=UPI0011611821|nr:hypothetical protein [Streptomyces sp. CB00455]
MSQVRILPRALSRTPSRSGLGVLCVLVRALDSSGSGSGFGFGSGFGERVERLSRELEAHLDAEEEQLPAVLRALGA